VAGIGPFSTALVDPAGYAELFPGCDINNSDMNGDAAVNGADIQVFIDTLLAP